MRRSADSTEYIDESDSPVEGLEEGTLAIKALNGNVIDIWKRPGRRAIQTTKNGNNTNNNDSEYYINFEIPYARVMPIETAENVNVKKYVVYAVCVYHHKHHQNSENATEATIPLATDDCSIENDGGDCAPQSISIERRYTHFLQLYTNLKRDHFAEMNRIPFPKKVLLGNFSNVLIAERSATFEAFLDYVVSVPVLRESEHFLKFLQDIELNAACQLLDERRNEQSLPILENIFFLLNKIFTDRSKPVLLLLCRIVAACTTSPVPHPSADRWSDLALRRYESVSDADLLILYIPLLRTIYFLWWKRGRDCAFLDERLQSMEQRGINTKKGKTLTEMIHEIDPRTETY